MDPPPRKELQGPRPAPLKIHKDSHKIRKPPPAPAPAGHRRNQAPPPPQTRQPVITYAVSPKVIHVNPSDFRDLVQRLTGLSSAEPATSSSSSAHPAADGVAVSPAARYAATEKAASNEYVRSSFAGDCERQHATTMTSTTMMTNRSSGGAAMELGMGVNGKGFISGILSPGPGSLPPISPGFFSSVPSDTFFNDLSSPVIHGGFTASPGGFGTSSSFFVSPRPHHLINSPTTPSFDHLFFNNIFSDHNL